MKVKSPWIVKPHSHVKLADVDTSATGGFTPEAAATVLVSHREQLAKLQEILYAGQQHAILVVLQGMDTAGKDGTISHIFSGINPQGCDVTSFKVPTPLEARHDFLWRCQAAAPARGTIGIFNRSHYEDVLSPRVHKLLSSKVAHRHMDDINAWESTLVDTGTIILKFFLNISQKEQTHRLQARLDDPEKHWKFSAADLTERKFWPEYQDAYEEIFERTSKKHAPWFVIPSDHKWYRNLVISTVLVRALEALKLKYPDPSLDVSKIKL